MNQQFVFDIANAHLVNCGVISKTPMVNNMAGWSYPSIAGVLLLIGLLPWEPSDAVEGRAVAPRTGTPQEIIAPLLEFAGVSAADTLLDAGCGDGRIVIEAAVRYRSKGICIDIDQRQINLAKENALHANVYDLIEFRQQDILVSDFSDATVVVLFLTPAGNVALLPKLRTLKPDTRVVSVQFHMGNSWLPDRSTSVRDSKGIARMLYLWVVPRNE